MHPLDVADLVVAGADRLRDIVAERPELRAVDVAVEDGSQMYVTFERVERKIMGADLPLEVVGPSGRTVLKRTRFVDLSAPPVTTVMILHLDCSGFDAEPPGGNLLDQFRVPLPGERWPKSLNRGIAVGHPDLNRPFFCRRGLREYHSHPKHRNDPWDTHREGLTLDGIVVEILEDLRTRWLG